MKVSNETKVGALAAIAITILILGYSFLKGGSLFSQKKHYYALYSDVGGLKPSNPVMLHGYKVGQIKEVKMEPITFRLKVKFEIEHDLHITENTIARIINVDLFGAKAIELELQDGKEASVGDTLVSDKEISLSRSIGQVLSPLASKLDGILGSLDTAIGKGRLKNNLKNMSEMMEAFEETSTRINGILGHQATKIDNIFSNVESITKNFKDNKDKINHAIANLNEFSDSLSAVDLKKTVDNANRALADFGEVMDRVNKGEGSIGLLVQDEKLYNNLNSSAASLNNLVVDLEKNPKKYLKFSLIDFGGDGKKKKEKKKPQEPAGKDK